MNIQDTLREVITPEGLYDLLNEYAFSTTPNWYSFVFLDRNYGRFLTNEQKVDLFSGREEIKYYLSFKYPDLAGEFIKIPSLSLEINNILLAQLYYQGIELFNLSKRYYQVRNS